MSGKIDSAAKRLGRSMMKPELAELAYFLKTPSQSADDIEGSHDATTSCEGNLIEEEQGTIGSTYAHVESTTAERPKDSDDLNARECLTGAFGPYSNSRCHSIGGFPFHESNATAQPGNGEARPFRWVLAAEALRKHPAIRKRFQPTEVKHAGNRALCLQEKHPEELVTFNSGNWTTKGLLPGMGGLLMGIVLWFASMGYGAVHAAAWNNYYPSIAEKWLWRTSSIYIMVCGLFWTLINLAAQASQKFDRYWESVRRPTAPWINSVPLGILFLACGTAYAFTRLFLVIEAFVSIRRLPVAAYDTPDWTQEIPHL